MSRQNGGVHNEEIVMPTTTVGIDSVIEKAVGIGIPVGLYAIAVAVSGKRGACAVTHALKLLGCGKMKYGVASLFVISQVSEEVAHMSVKIPSKQALKQRMMDGEEEASVLRSVDQLPVSGDMNSDCVGEGKKRRAFRNKCPARDGRHGGDTISGRRFPPVRGF